MTHRLEWRRFNGPVSLIRFENATHRRRIKKEEKAKVVASVRGEEFIHILAALDVLPRKILNNRMNCTRMI